MVEKRILNRWVLASQRMSTLIDLYENNDDIHNGYQQKWLNNQVGNGGNPLGGVYTSTGGAHVNNKNAAPTKHQFEDDLGSDATATPRYV